MKEEDLIPPPKPNQKLSINSIEYEILEIVNRTGILEIFLEKLGN